MNTSNVVRERQPGAQPQRNWATVASTANISSLSGTGLTIDGVAMTSGYVLAKDQSTASQNGLYRVRSGAWLKIGQPEFVAVEKGTAWGQKTFYLTAANTYTVGGGVHYAKAASTLLNTTLSGTTTIDGVSLSAGDLVLVKDQSTASQNGLYVVQSSTWIKLGQPQFVAVWKGTANINQIFYLDSNVYSQGPRQRWRTQSFSGVTVASSTQFTLNSGAPSAPAGTPIRFRDGGGNYLYAVVSQDNGTSLDIAGPSLAGLTVGIIEYGDPELVVQVDLFVPGLYAVSTGNVLAAQAHSYFNWQFGPAAIVNFKAWNHDNGAGTAVVNLKIGSNAVAVTGITPTSSGVVAGLVDASKYALTRGSALEIAVGTADATAQDLTISATVVLA